MSLQADPGPMSAPMEGPRAAALLLALAAAATVGGALFIEHVMGVKPCDLCLTQRIPYYAGVPLALAVAWLGGAASRRRLAIAGLVLLGVLPVVAMSLLADALLGALAQATSLRAT